MSNNLSLRKRIALETARKIRKNNIELHSLRQLFWECTLRCNLQCRHCGSDCRKVVEQDDMPLKDFLTVIDSITPHVNPNEVSIIISGGEPLLRDDLEECGLALYKRGYPWGFVTNGLYLSRARLDNLMASGLHAITISLDGFSDEHNWLRGHTESFSQATKAIKMLAEEEEDLLWDVVTCVNSRNYPYLSSFKNYLINLGVRNWRVFTIFPVGRAAKSSELQLSDKEFKGLLDFVKQARKAGIHVSYACEGFLGEYEGDVRDHFYSCNAGVSVASILADGSISACPSIRSNFHQGNIYKDDFMDVWENGFQKLRNREWARTGQCASCDLFRYCEGNGLHLRDDKEELLLCHYNRLV